MTLLYIIIGIIAVVGGIWYMKKSKKPQVPMNPPQQPPAQPPTQTPPSMPGM